MYLTFRLQRRGFEVLSPGGEHRSGETLVAVADPRRRRALPRRARDLVTEKPEGLRIATHFFNNERDVDRCVEALVAVPQALGSGARPWVAPPQARLLQLAFSAFSAPQLPT